MAKYLFRVVAAPQGCSLGDAKLILEGVLANANRMLTSVQFEIEEPHDWHEYERRRSHGEDDCSCPFYHDGSCDNPTNVRH